jgi:hypothetical protein
MPADSMLNEAHMSERRRGMTQHVLISRIHRDGGGVATPHGFHTARRRP